MAKREWKPGDKVWCWSKWQTSGIHECVIQECTTHYWPGVRRCDGKGQTWYVLPSYICETRELAVKAANEFLEKELQKLKGKISKLESIVIK